MLSSLYSERLLFELSPSVFVVEPAGISGRALRLHELQHAAHSSAAVWPVCAARESDCQRPASALHI